MSEAATKTDILYLKEQLNRIESELVDIKMTVKLILINKD
jgi:hypothetical protein